MAWEQETFSEVFGVVEGVELKQTLSSSYDAFRGIHVSGSNNSVNNRYSINNINSSSFGNSFHLIPGGSASNVPFILDSVDSLHKYNLDGRIPLGMFCFKNENLSSHNFPNGIIPGEMFESIAKHNLIQNGDCAQIAETYISSNGFEQDGVSRPMIFKPAGGWKFMYHDGIGKQCIEPDGSVDNETLPHTEGHYKNQTPGQNLPG